ncbi:MAG: MJ0042-type zinc finger domain-containing protein [Pseudomonadota bacterium]
MILTCPECETQYFAEDSTIGESGRTVKCAACGHSWFVGPEGSSQGTAALGAHETYRLKVRERRRRKSRAAALSAWTATVAAFFVILAGLVLFRGEVVKRWPESASTYAAMGMPVNRFGLEFMETEAQRYFDGTTPILEVRGAVQNITGRSLNAPLVRVILLDDQGDKVAEAFAPISPSSIPEGATAVFAARVENPPFESFELELDLVPADTAMVENGTT